MATIKCPKCGHEFSETVQKCYYCGTSLAEKDIGLQPTSKPQPPTQTPNSTASKQVAPTENTPSKKTFVMKSGIFWIAVICTLLFPLFLIVAIINDDTEWARQCVIGLICMAVFWGIAIGLVKKLNADDNYAQAYEDKYINKSHKSSDYTVECPYCHSTDTSKISNVSKAVGAAMIGVHSIPRNSKQWHCNNCKSDF